MRRDDHMAALDDLLSRWHTWASGYNPLPRVSNDPMFANAKSGRGWEENSESVDSELNGQTMEAIDFQAGEMKEPYRTAIYINARNCATGRKVWSSPRLPADPLQCAQIVGEARSMLCERLMNVGLI